MIKAIRDLGFFELKEVSCEEIFDIEEFEQIREKNPQLVAKLIAEKIEPKGKPIKVYAIRCKDGKLSWEFDETIYKNNNPTPDDSQKSYRFYLFKEPRSTRGEEKGTYICLSFKLVNTSAGKLFGYLSKNKVDDSPDELKEFYKLVDKGKNVFKKEVDKIFDEIKKTSDINKNFVMVTMRPDGKYLSNYKSLAENFVKGFLAEYKFPEDKVPKDYDPLIQHGQCSVCLRENLHLLGYLRPYNFFTVDKAGFYPSFKNYESWKYFPVCESCGILIQAGKNFLENHFRARLAGYNVLIILKNKELIEKQKRFVDFENIKYFAQIADIERHLIKKLPELTIAESYNFLFYKEKQNQFEILGLIPDVLPSRIKEIADSIKEIKERFEQSNWFDLDKIQKRKGNWRIDTDFYFLEESIGERVDFPGKEFSPTKIRVLNLIQAIFTGYPVSYRVIVSEISAKIQFCFRGALKLTKDNRPLIDKFTSYVFSGAATIEFLKEVKVMGTEVVKATGSEDYPEKLKEVFEMHKIFFDTPQKRTCFLIGVLYGKLEALQASPLIGKKGTSLGWLRSLDLRWDYLIRDLFPRIHLKFKEYDNAIPILGKEVKDIFSHASYEIEECGESSLDRGEIPFYFTLGWTSYKRILPPKIKEEDTDEGDLTNT